MICESLDRISRENIKEALSLFLSILNKGITIITLSPAETKIYDKNASEIDIITSLLIFSRANNESKIKSERVKSAWKEKRKKLEKWSSSPDSIPGKPPFIATSSKPAWIDIEWQNRKQRLGSFRFNEEKSALIRRIIDEYLSGIGFGQIAKRLNEEKVDPPVRAEYWHVSYLKKLLSYPALYGALVIKEMETYQSKTGRYVRRPVETGEVIENRQLFFNRNKKEPLSCESWYGEKKVCGRTDTIQKRLTFIFCISSPPTNKPSKNKFFSLYPHNTLDR